jgi:hypothetical protein
MVLVSEVVILSAAKDLLFFYLRVQPVSENRRFLVQAE